ncbi:hypothetical protein GMB86_11915 [Terrilactibacillus sp. BCM23-1]|uniref:Uncharacterized protein n=1 Tax=Terrilactibacillus tamarindi TaxID=2599694 RepID=A0A6N8CUA7_9BACI|nr:hypothetical protein [Terrilactibacillus tamarindi]MTT32713.1 hypothetical protein [Terrilactibacillus tamarindi]
MNIFNPIQQDRQYIFNNLGQDILINDTTEPIKAIINHVAPNKFYDDLNIVTLTSINRGDIVTYNNRHYLILSEVSTDRYGKFKAVMRHLTYILKVKTGTEQTWDGQTVDQFGTPVYTTVDKYEYPRVFVQNDPSIQIQDTGGITYIDSKMQVIMQDKQDSPFIVGLQFNLNGKRWKIISVDVSKQGIRLLNLDNVAEDTNDPITHDMVDGDEIPSDTSNPPNTGDTGDTGDSEPTEPTPTEPTPKYATTGDDQIDEFVLRHQGDNGSDDLGDPNNQDNTNYWKYDWDGETIDDFGNPVYSYIRKTYDELVAEFES